MSHEEVHFDDITIKSQNMKYNVDVIIEIKEPIKQYSHLKNIDIQDDIIFSVDNVKNMFKTLKKSTNIIPKSTTQTINSKFIKSRKKILNNSTFPNNTTNTIFHSTIDKIGNQFITFGPVIPTQYKNMTKSKEFYIIDDSDDDLIIEDDLIVKEDD